MVLLQHTLPDGTRHFDWLIEPVGAGPGSIDARNADDGDPDERCLISFRVMDRIDSPRITSFPADALPLHRRKYLQFQGDVEGKGAVKRITGGMVRKVEVLGHDKNGEMTAITIRGKFTVAGMGLEYIWAGMRDDGENALWQFRRSAPSMLQNKSTVERRDSNPLTRDLNDDGPWLRPGIL
jgi:hypothetical protein